MKSILTITYLLIGLARAAPSTGETKAAAAWVIDREVQVVSPQGGAPIRFAGLVTRSTLLPLHTVPEGLGEVIYLYYDEGKIYGFVGTRSSFCTAVAQDALYAPWQISLRRGARLQVRTLATHPALAGCQIDPTATVEWTGETLSMTEGLGFVVNQGSSAGWFDGLPVRACVDGIRRSGVVSGVTQNVSVVYFPTYSGGGSPHPMIENIQVRFTPTCPGP